MHLLFVYTLIRVILGLTFVVQGADKIFGLGLRSTTAQIGLHFQRTGLPPLLVATLAFLTSWIELLAGLLLLTGLFTFPALVLLGFDLLIASFGFMLLQPVWDFKPIWPRLVLWGFLLWFLEYNTWSLDSWLAPILF